MQRSLLIFAIALVALIAGVLFYTAKLSTTVPDELAGPYDPIAPATEKLAAAGPVYVSFELADMNGEPRDFSEWHGKHRLINFWATWCAPCRREIPLLKAFQEKHAANGLQVIGIAVDFPEPVAEYAEAAEFNYPILVGEQDAMAVAESSGVDFIGLPFTMIVAADGELVATHMGEIHQIQLDEIADVLGQFDRGEIDKPSAQSRLNSL